MTLLHKSKKNSERGKEDSLIEDVKSADDTSVETGKKNHKRVRDKDDESADVEEWHNVWF